MDPLLSIIPGDIKKRTANTNRHSDLNTHLEKMKSEFIGKPAVCYELVKHIIYLRRNVNVEENRKKFFELLEKYMDVLLTEYDLRWLVSVCDTIVDVGSDVCSGAAMCVVVTVNNVNITESIVDIMHDGRIDQQKLSARAQNKRPTYDGMITMDRFSGDCMINMQKRMNTVIDKSPMVSKIWTEIKRRLKSNAEIPINKLCSIHGVPERKTFFV